MTEPLVTGSGAPIFVDKISISRIQPTNATGMKMMNTTRVSQRDAKSRSKTNCSTDAENLGYLEFDVSRYYEQGRFLTRQAGQNHDGVVVTEPHTEFHWQIHFVVDGLNLACMSHHLFISFQSNTDQKQVALSLTAMLRLSSRSTWRLDLIHLQNNPISFCSFLI